MSRRGAAWALAALPVLAGDGVASSPGGPRASAHPSPGRNRLAAAKGAWRPIEGRLCISGPATGPVDAVPRPADALAFASAAAEISTVGEAETADAGALHDLGLLRIYEGRLDDAARLLAAAAAQPAAPACAWSDLAAVHLAEAVRRDEPRTLVAALDAVLRAGNEPAARFNRALIKDRLFLPSAHEEWARVAQGEDDATWRDEAQRNLEASAPPAAPVWPPPPDWTEAQVREAARRSAHTVRAWVFDTLLPHLISGDGDERLATAAAAALSVAGDDYPEACLASSRAVVDRHDGAAEVLRAATAEATEAARLFAADQFAPAREGYRSAVTRLSQTGSPLELSALLELARCDYYVGDATTALAHAQEVLDRADPRWPTVRAHALRLRGLLLFERGRFAEALQDYSAAAPLLDAAGEWDWAAHVHYLVGEVLRHIGQRQLAWRERLKGFAALRALGMPSRHVLVLGDAAQALLEERLYWAAAAVAEEFVLAAKPSHDGVLIGTAQRLHASTLLASGRRAGARLSLAVARDTVRDTADLGLKRRVEADVDLDMARLELSTGRSEEALRLLARVRRTYESAGLDWVLGQAAQLRGRALLALGRRTEARSALEEAVQRLARQGAGLTGAALQAGFNGRHEDDVQELLLLEAAAAGRARTALAHAEQALDIQHLASTPHVEAEVRALELRLDRDLAVLEITLVHDRALAWVVTHRGTSQVVLPTPAVRLAASLSALEESLERREEGARPLPHLTRLYAELIQPLEKHLYGTRRLVIVPHGLLWRVPWAALTDVRGRPAVFRWTLSLSPSALALSPVGVHRRDDSSGRALVIGNPAFDRSALPWLQDLGRADDEARAVAALHAGATLLTGASAAVPRVLTELAHARVFHYAGHVITNATSGEAALPLAPEPGIAPGRQGSMLYGSDVRALDLGSLDLAVLSSCRASSEPGRVETGATSVARAFLDAGAGAVVGGLWDVNDATAGGFMEALHRALREHGDPACALADVQRRFASQGDGGDVMTWGGYEVLSRRLPTSCRLEERGNE